MTSRISDDSCRARARKIMKAMFPDLQSDQVVHHVDFNPQNNDLANLAIISKSEHSILHGTINPPRKSKHDFVSRTFWLRRDQVKSLKEISEREERSITTIVRKGLDMVIKERREGE